MPQTVKEAPHWTSPATRPFMAGTGAGSPPALAWPRPSCPSAFRPNVMTWPVSEMQAVCAAPADTEMILCLTARTRVGVSAYDKNRFERT